MRVGPVSSKKQSGHTARRNSSFVTTSPARCTSTSSVCNTFGAKGTTSSARHSRVPSEVSRNRSKAYLPSRRTRSSVQRVRAKGIVTTREGLAVLSPSHCPTRRTHDRETDGTRIRVPDARPCGPANAAAWPVARAGRCWLRRRAPDLEDHDRQAPRYIVRCADVTDVQRAVTSRASRACRCLSAAAATTLPASRCATTA